MTDKPIQKVVIVGGGSAGWITAGILAADHHGGHEQGIDITLIASPEVNTIGVGEGTWPTMRATLQRIGISETDFFRQCDASFKQGSQFKGWVDGSASDSYYHPFSLPAGFEQGINLAPTWQQFRDKVSFTNAVCAQGYICDQNLAPKLNTQREFEGLFNYGYHLDATKFAALLQKHCTEQLGVRYIADHITSVNAAVNGDISSVTTKIHGEVAGCLFIDCSGLSALLIGKHYNIGFNSQKSVLFNDRAIVTQVPYTNEDVPIPSCTISTAQSAGWIWDISLPQRRGCGYTYSSAHLDDERAERALRQYVDDHSGQYDVRRLQFEPGFRDKFWHHNCVAVGLSAGFLEPLEASALVMIELAANQISESLPAVPSLMDTAAARFNRQFSYRWQRIIDFLKLHYVLSQRADSDYWHDNKANESMPQSLKTQLNWWQYHSPWLGDFSEAQEVFSAASYQYVLYGMGFYSKGRSSQSRLDLPPQAMALFQQVNREANQQLPRLSSNRQTIAQIVERGLYGI